MKYGSVCSGIEAATVAWHPLGWEAQWFSEIDKFPSRVLAHRYPGVPNLGDMTKIHETEVFNATTIDVLVGGTPCQSFSIAGLRKGMGDPRGQLMLTFVELAARKRPKWVVWENVPGVLSSNGGEDFAAFLGALTGRQVSVPSGGFRNSGCIEGIGAAYGVAWRILDAQYFGVAQRRRRVFVVGYLGDWRCAAAVLFERESLSGNPAPSREARKGTAGGIEIGPLQRCQSNIGARMTAFGEYEVDETASAMKARDYKDATDLVIGGVLPFDTTQVTSPANFSSPKEGDPCHPITAGGNPPSICFQQNTRDEVRYVGGDGQIAGAIMAEAGMKQQNYIAFGVGEDSDTAHCLRSGASKADKHESTTYVVSACDTADTLSVGANQTTGFVGDVVTQVVHGTLDQGSQHAVAYSFDSLASNSMKSDNPESGCRLVELAKTLDTTTPEPSKNQGGIGVLQHMAVRRLTPRECERLQGFPDDYTKINDNTADGSRYKALGNSMARPVMEWIGRRIDAVNSIANQ